MERGLGRGECRAETSTETQGNRKADRLGAVPGVSPRAVTF